MIGKVYNIPPQPPVEEHMRRAEQFFGIAPGKALEATREPVGIRLERATLGRDRALAVFDSATPLGGSGSLDLHRAVVRSDGIQDLGDSPG